MSLFIARLIGTSHSHKIHPYIIAIHLLAKLYYVVHEYAIYMIVSNIVLSHILNNYLNEHPKRLMLSFDIILYMRHAYYILVFMS